MPVHKVKFPGSGLRAYRQAEGLTLAQLSARTGASGAYLSRVERGQRVLSPSMALMIATRLGVPLAALAAAGPLDVDGDNVVAVPG